MQRTSCNDRVRPICDIGREICCMHKPVPYPNMIASAYLGPLVATKRTFAVMQQFGRFWGEADMREVAVRKMLFGSRPTEM
jgi:hypothetical protein